MGDQEMDEKPQSARLDRLKSDFRSLLVFHENSFKEIDGKARYWLTVTLPSALALSAFVLEKHSTLSPLLVSSTTALAVSLLIAVYIFSSTLMSLQIQSGILAPKSRVFTNSRDVVEEEEKWEELQLKQADELLRAIKNNESQNAVKSRRLRRAEVSLFRGAPTGTILAACAAFAYTRASPLFGAAPCTTALVSDTSPATAGIAAAGIGTFVGAGTTALFVAFDHYRTSRKLGNNQ